MSAPLYQRSRRRRELALVPLIDVLVMLVFFAFVTMQFRVKPAPTLNVRLPKIETAGQNEFKGPITIGITKDGAFSFNGKAATEAQLASLLAQAHDVDKDIPVLIRADEATQLKEITLVMDACRKAGLNKFSLQSR
jgi:biopolymer transport protein ExbD